MPSYLKSLLTLVLLPGIAGAEAGAQDRIYTKIGAVIDVRVTAASIARVKYYAPAGADSLLHRISGDRVQKIEYEDGRVWERRPAHIRQIDRKAEKRIVRNNISSRAYPNVITLNAPHLVLLQSLTGIACGLEYERFLDPRGYWSLHLPAYLTTKVSSDIYGGIRRGDVFEEGKAQYAAPGVLFHPLGNKRRADIGLGIQYLFGSIRTETTEYRYSGHDTIYTDRYNLSILVANARANFYSRGHFVFGLYLGYGLSVAQQTNAQHDGIFQFGIKLGGRF